MRRGSIVAIAFTFLACARCSTSDSEPEGSKTNQSICDTDLDCDPGFSCVAQECTPDESATGGAPSSEPDAAPPIETGGTDTGGSGGSSGSVNTGGIPGDPPPLVIVPPDVSGLTGCGLPTPLTPEQWQTCSAPRTDAHSIESRDCEPVTFSPDYQVEPTVSCSIAPGYNVATYPVRLCDIEPFCLHHDECTEGQNGRCVGVGDATCSYPDEAAFRQTPCTSDADCQAVPGGSCPQPFNDDIPCYPTGECRQGRFCWFPWATCTQDADCTVLPGGSCKNTILYAQCEYHECLADADCGASERCACKTCVPSACDTDADCGLGEQCRLEYGCLGALVGYRCSTALDECASEADCPGNQPCEFGVDRWRCRTEGCPIPR